MGPSPVRLEDQEDLPTDVSESFTCQNGEQVSQSASRDLCTGMHKASLGLNSFPSLLQPQACYSPFCNAPDLSRSTSGLLGLQVWEEGA